MLRIISFPPPLSLTPYPQVALKCHYPILSCNVAVIIKLIFLLYETCIICSGVFFITVDGFTRAFLNFLRVALSPTASGVIVCHVEI